MNGKHFLILSALLPLIACSTPADQSVASGDEAAVAEVGESLSPTGARAGRGAGPGRGQGLRQGSPGDGRGLGSGRRQAVSLSAEEAAAVDLQTVVVARRQLESELAAIGKVVAPPRTKAIVSYAFPARISEVHVRLGDWVERGQQLVTLQSEEVGIARADYYKAVADFDLARANDERQRRLMDRGVGAGKDAITAEAELTVARSSLEAAEKKLHILGFTEEQVLDLADSHQVNPTISLHAPISGTVVENNAVMGAMIDQETEILTVMDPHLLRIDMEIYEKDIARIRLGQRVEARVPAYADEVFVGTIQYVSDLFKEDTRTITAYTEVANADYKLKAGMFAEVSILLDQRDQVLCLPRSAVLDDGTSKIVFVERGAEYVPVVVETGIEENGFVEISTGLEEGDIVVTSGNFQLKSKMYEDVLNRGHGHRP